jgi:hypothetical protein
VFEDGLKDSFLVDEMFVELGLAGSGKAANGGSGGFLLTALSEKRFGRFAQTVTAGSKGRCFQDRHQCWLKRPPQTDPFSQ